jgi:alpha,alpha-trehalose phosphorylase
VVKQPDLALAMAFCPLAFTEEQKARNFCYYERITVRDSSLSACIEALLAAECGYLQLAFDYAAEATLMDLQDIEHNVRDGLHMASLAGAWIAFVFGLGGMRDHGDTLTFKPKLPTGLTRYAFSIMHRQQILHVNITGAGAEYTLKTPGTLRVSHYDESLVVTDAEMTVRPIPPVPHRDPPKQPRGRAPKRRSRG